MEDFEQRAVEAEKQIEILKKKIASLEQQVVSQDKGGEEEKQEAEKEEKSSIAAFEVSQQRIWELLEKQEPLTGEEKFELMRSIGEECIRDDDLRNLLAKKPNPTCYDGFEPSGRMHIAQGILKSINVNKCTKAGCTFIFWVADWFAMLNNKMGGDLKKIRVVGEYMIEVWKACGMDMNNVKFIWSSEEINANPNEYWLRVMDIATKFKLPRVIRCSTIMGRENEKELFSSQIFYPCMQCADIFYLKADICQLGMDQRKVNMLAREYCDLVKPKIKLKPIILSHHMLMGLEKDMEKMSKSKPNSAIFMEDSVAEVNSKIKTAYCPPQVIEKNPCIDYLKHIVFQSRKEFVVSRKEENGGNKTYTSFEDLVKDYTEGLLHPGDLKPALAKAINEIIEPVRKHFETDQRAKGLLAQVKKYRTTR